MHGLADFAHITANYSKTGMALNGIARGSKGGAGAKLKYEIVSDHSLVEPVCLECERGLVFGAGDRYRADDVDAAFGLDQRQKRSV